MSRKVIVVPDRRVTVADVRALTEADVYLAESQMLADIVEDML